jgi:hypothetical protein
MNRHSIFTRAFGLRICFIAAFIMMMFGAGCSSSQKLERSEKTEREPARSQTEPQEFLVEDFNPMTLQGAEFTIPRKQVVKNVDSLATLAPALADTSWQTVPGFQVQLLQTEDAHLARETVKDAILALDTDVEIIYEAPYYKVRAGRFTNRYDAEQLQLRAEEKGYATCWVVRTPVKVRANELFNQR